MRSRWKTLPWRNKIFSWGITITCLGIFGFLLHAFNSYPLLNDLDVHKGAVKSIENWHRKGGIHGIDVLLAESDGAKRFNVGYCGVALKLIKINDVVEIFASNSGASIVDGRIWQLVKNGQILCDYEDTLKVKRKSDHNNLKLSLLSLAVGLGLSIYGYLRR